MHITKIHSSLLARISIHVLRTLTDTTHITHTHMHSHAAVANANGVRTVCERGAYPSKRAFLSIIGYSWCTHTHTQIRSYVRGALCPNPHYGPDNRSPTRTSITQNPLATGAPHTADGTQHTDTAHHQHARMHAHIVHQHLCTQTHARRIHAHKRLLKRRVSSA